MKKRCKQEVRFAICITDSEPDLELRKIYQILPDEAAAEENHLRVIDESGDDYLYPAGYFVLVKVVKEAEGVLLLVPPKDT